MRKYREIFFCLGLFCVACYGFGRLYSSLTDGFSLANITYTKPYNPRWESALDPIIVEDALSQTYRYLGKGHQSFVFESADGRFVVKFLKCHLVEIKPWLAWLPLPAFAERWRHSRREAKKKRLEGIFTGWKIAFEQLPAETGVLAVHMNATNSLQKHLSVVNKAGWAYQVNLDQTAFLVQKKVDMLIPTLEQLMQKNSSEEAKSLLASLISLYAKMCSSGISDQDPQIMRNTGVLAGQPILIDVGRFKSNPEVKKWNACKAEIVKKTALFRKWLGVHYPDLVSYFEQQIDLVGKETDVSMAA